MNVVQESVGPLEAILKVELVKDDYQERVTKELKSMQRKAQMPGFRPGKVPFGMVQKMYGKGVLVEEVNKILADAVYTYIKDNKLSVLGHPIADKQHAEQVDWDNLTDQTFHYYLGLAPEIDLDLSKEIEVEYHTIRVDEKMVDGHLMDLRKRYGKMITPGVSEAGDVLYGLFEEMESEDQTKVEGRNHKSSVYIEYIKDNDTKERLVGRKAGEAIVFDIAKATGSDAEAAAMIGLKKEDLAEKGTLYRFTVESISRNEPAELNQDFFDKLVPGRALEGEDAFRDLLRDQISQQYQADVDRHFKNQVRKKLIEITDLPLPEKFLKTWLLDTNKESFTEEKIDEEFDELKDTFRWQLIENHLLKKYEVKVSQQEIHDYLSAYFTAQFKQYGQEEIDDSLIEGFIRNVTSKEEEVKKVYDQLSEQKLLSVFKELLGLKQTELTFDEFVTLVTNSAKDIKRIEDNE